MERGVAASRAMTRRRSRQVRAKMLFWVRNGVCSESSTSPQRCGPGRARVRVRWGDWCSMGRRAVGVEPGRRGVRVKVRGGLQPPRAPSISRERPLAPSCTCVLRRACLRARRRAWALVRDCLLDCLLCANVRLPAVCQRAPACCVPACACRLRACACLRA
jgi:hypothetical protein